MDKPHGFSVLAALSWKTSRGLRFIGILALVMIFCGAGTEKAPASSLLYKSYVIRYDRGWDILCEPYEVQPNDWVLKIFRQKGEISTRDFREFLGIFKRLNPHIKNVDRIRPGQVIDIPLKKLDPDTLPGQSSGIVTIPFVTLSKSSELIQKHSSKYRVRKGDTVSRLIARRFGKFGSRGYKEGIKLFKAVNPGIKNLNLIYAGQKIYMPDPAIRQQSWYASLYDKKGNLKSKLDTQALASSAAAAMVKPERPETKTDDNLEPLVRAAKIVGGKLYSRGTYYFPQEGKPDFELDLTRYPVLDLENGKKILFTHQERIMDVEAALLETYWQNVKIIRLEDNEGTAGIVGRIFNSLEENGNEPAELYYTDQGAQINVKAKWIKTETDGRHLCITPIEDERQKTPENIKRYLEKLGIVLKEIIERQEAPGQADSALSAKQTHRVKPVLALAPNGRKDLVSQVVKIFGYNFSSNIEISFPYAGIQVKALSNLVTNGDGHQWLVDFGNLYGDAVSAIEKSGLPVIQVKTDSDDFQALIHVLSGLGYRVEKNPTYLAAKRPAQYNTIITVKGILVHDSQQVFFLTNEPLNPVVQDLITSQGIKLILWS